MDSRFRGRAARRTGSERDQFAMRDGGKHRKHPAHGHRIGDRCAGGSERRHERDEKQHLHAGGASGRAEYEPIAATVVEIEERGGNPCG